MTKCNNICTKLIPKRSASIHELIWLTLQNRNPKRNEQNWLRGWAISRTHNMARAWVCAVLLLLMMNPSKQIHLLKISKEVFDVTISKDTTNSDSEQSIKSLGTIPTLRRRFFVFRIFFDQVSARLECVVLSDGVSLSFNTPAIFGRIY